MGSMGIERSSVHAGLSAFLGGIFSEFQIVNPIIIFSHLYPSQPCTKFHWNRKCAFLVVKIYN